MWVFYPIIIMNMKLLCARACARTHSHACTHAPVHNRCVCACVLVSTCACVLILYVITARQIVTKCCIQVTYVWSYMRIYYFLSRKKCVVSVEFPKNCVSFQVNLRITNRDQKTFVLISVRLVWIAYLDHIVLCNLYNVLQYNVVLVWGLPFEA